MTAEATRVDAPRAFPVPVAAKQLSLSESNCWNLIKRGEIRVVRIGRRTLVTASELNRLLGESDR